MAAAIVLAACASGGPGAHYYPPQAVPIDPAAAPWSHAPAAATNTISASAVLRAGGDVVWTCAGRLAGVIPATDFAAERIGLAFGRSRTGFVPIDRLGRFRGMPPEVFVDRNRLVACNSQGEFQVEALPDGDYFVVATVTGPILGAAANGAPRAARGGAFVQRVRLAGNAVQRVAFSAQAPAGAGPEHPDGRADDFVLTLTSGESASDRAGLIFADRYPGMLWVEGRIAEAEVEYIKALRAQERVYGRDAENTLDTVYGFARFYQSQGRYPQAEALYLRMLEARERLAGRDDSETLGVLNDLAALYVAQGRTDAAEPMLTRVLETNRRLYGRDNMRTLPSASAVATLYVAQGRYVEAEALMLQILEADERSGRSGVFRQNYLLDLADLYDVQGRVREAERLRIRVEEGRVRAMEANIARLQDENAIPIIDRLEGDYAPSIPASRDDAAGPLFLRSLRASERLAGADDDNTLTAASNLASWYAVRGRFAEAEPLYQRILEATERLTGADSPDTVSALYELADLYLAQRRFADAERLYRRAVEANRRVAGRELDLIGSIDSMAYLYQLSGRRAEADRLLVPVLGATREVLGDAHPGTVDAAEQLASLRLSSPDSAASALEPARLIVASLRARRSAVREGGIARAQLGREQRDRAALFTLLPNAAWAAATADPGQRTALTDEAFTALQDSSVGAADEALAQMAVRHVADRERAGLAPLARERENLNNQWAANSASYSDLLGVSGAEASATRQRLTAERTRIGTRLDEIDAVLRANYPPYFTLIRPEPLDVAATQAMLAPDEAILLVVPTEYGTHVVGVSRDRILWVRSPRTREEVDGAVGQLLGNIRTTMAGGSLSYDRQTAFALYRDIVAPVAPVLDHKRHVFTVAAGSLTSLPFGILVTEPPAGADDDLAALRDTRWFADAHALIQLPSIQSLQLLRRPGSAAPRPPGAPSSFVGFGNPALSGPATATARSPCDRGGRQAGTSVAMLAAPGRARGGGMNVDLEAIRQLCPLPGTAVELENMRLAFQAPPGALYLGQNATEARLRSMNLSQVRILAFATHGVLAGELQGVAEPGLVFTPPRVATEADDGYLTASEIAALNLDADWVILSACDTATGEVVGAPGLSGLARAFFYAGARNLLASHWKVADDAAARLTVRTIELMRENPALSRAEALQRAMREVREDPDREHQVWAHPGVWGPFSLIGDGAR
jgi:CHAT domain-containing protein/tetratricopeptide (TPR) repeat protein